MSPKIQNGLKRDLGLIYVRESRHRLGDPDESPERQVARCIRLCQDRGWRYEIFQEPPGHRSGKHEAGRPKWKELKDRLKQTDVVAVVVSRLDRASRSLIDFSNFLTYLNQYNVEFVSVTENFDTTSAMGKAFLRIILILLELESDVTSERSLEMIAHKKEKGLTWGGIPYGYERKQSILSVSNDGVQKDSKVLRDIEAIRLVLEGYAKGELSYEGGAKKLNALGFRMKDRYGRRHLFNHKNIRTFVENAMLYAGFIPNKDGWAKGQHPALVSQEVAEKVEAMRVKRRFKEAGRRPNRPYALSTLLYCGNCQTKLLGAGPQWGGKYYYRHYARGGQSNLCQKGWTQVETTEIEGQVRDAILQLQIPSEAEPIMRGLAEARARMAASNDSQAARETIVRLEGQLERAKKLFIAGDLSEEGYETEKETLNHLIEEERIKIAPPPYNADVLIEKLRHVGSIIAQTNDPLMFKRAVGMLFERLETTRQEDGTWKLTKVIPREEFRDFF